MKLSKLVTTLSFEIRPGERWAVLGPEADQFRSKLPLAELLDTVEPDLDGLLLVGAVSAGADRVDWLMQTGQSMKEGATLIVVDWQYDGSLEIGPELEQRVKRGRLCRLLRQAGFGQTEVMTNHPLYYVVKAKKGPPDSRPYAGKYVKVAELKELPRNGMKKVELFGHNIVVANTGKEIVAFARACPHGQSPLDQGLLRGQNIVCRSHGYIWNVCSGEPVEPADEDMLPRYSVRLEPESGHILVAIGPEPS